MKAYLSGWSRTQLRVLGIGAVLIVLGGGIAFAQSPTPANAPSRPPPAAEAPVPPTPPGARSFMLTDQDIQLIVTFANDCVKTRGLDCAEAALMIQRKLQMPAPPVVPPK